MTLNAIFDVVAHLTMWVLVENFVSDQWPLIQLQDELNFLFWNLNSDGMSNDPWCCCLMQYVIHDVELVATPKTSIENINSFFMMWSLEGMFEPRWS